jgi:hypothetical protein
MYNFVEVSGNNFESSQTLDLRIQCLHYKQVHITFARGGGGGRRKIRLEEVTVNS